MKGTLQADKIKAPASVLGGKLLDASGYPKDENSKASLEVSKPLDAKAVGQQGGSVGTEASGKEDWTKSFSPIAADSKSTKISASPTFSRGGK